MTIPFDDAVAQALVSAADTAAGVVRGQGYGRHGVVSHTLDEFEGAYARAFAAGSVVEAEDRGLLARALDDLSVQVGEAQRRAAEERERLAELAAWTARDAVRQEQGALAPANTLVATWYDPRPADYPVSPPHISTAFTARERSRAVSDCIGGGQTSADPERLRFFVSTTGPMDAALREQMNAVRTAWTGFTASCSWVPIDRSTLLDGWQRLLDENTTDATWIGGIADAFDRAGSGTLSDLDVALATSATFPQSTQDLLVSGTLTTEQVAVAWAMLAQSPSADPSAFVRQWANVLGSLDGLPAFVRVEANRYRVPELLRAAERELAGLENSQDEDELSRAEMIRNEITYLKSVQTGDVQLYLYDRDASRIVEMIGTPGPDTTRAITYVPGTFTGMNSFYTGGVQQIAQYLTTQVPGTVAFVYKDGKFPGEQNNAQEPDLKRFLRIGEANDQDTAREAGEQLAQFQAGMRSDPSLSGVEQIGIGHSWGVANLTGSEVAGSEYDKVISLAGAGMLPDWRPNDDTTYTDLSYRDILLHFQSKGLVWDGNNPRSNGAFEHGPLYVGPDDAELDGRFVDGDEWGVLTDNHNLIASTDRDNDEALGDLKRLVEQ
ncbi:hypothetical protein MTES_2819 [Microbacterium testaceum StLB037]|uniref:Alpha/beta hydrolase n=1 Tax=Microbacterium testaceum (strain StLB037) TaxID=979556 RepID=E8N9D7_MICTS|nr:hypothetical protein [Microbacterium testaceum]BAJ75783.1 hypothetical protein MTES_2819 [Microbacterium testaceum StLB037]